MSETAVSLLARVAGTLARMLVVLWGGGMWTVGYVVAPVLFDMLDDRMLAGNIAGRLFTFVARMGMGAAVYLLVSMLARRGRAVLRDGLFRVTAAMLLCVAIGYFGIQAGVGSMDVMENAARERFAALHGVSSAIYLVQSILGVWLVAATRRQGPPIDCTHYTVGLSI